MVAVMNYVFYYNMRLLLFTWPLALLYPLWKRPALAEAGKRQLLLQFKEAIQLMSSYLAAGYSPENACIRTASDLERHFGEEALICREWQTMVLGLEGKRTLEQMLGEFSQRADLEEISSYAEIFAIAKRSGGELVKIIGNTVELIQEKISLTQEIYLMTAAKRYEQKLMNVMPLALIVYMNKTAPEIFAFFYTRTAGRAAMTLCLGIYLFSIWLSARILKIQI